ncbi:MAG: glycogen synthase [Acidobacteria bacterium]|nr:glycogen synthase [Acidobacteriota bacterium]
MRVVIASSEVVPYSKTGGLADVAGALPKALTRIGVDALVITPRYTGLGKRSGDVVREDTGELLFDDLRVPFDGEIKGGRVWRDWQDDTPFYFIENAQYFGHGYIYDQGDWDAERFAYFSRAVLELCKRLGAPPDVLHCNDWQTGLIPVHLATTYRDDPYFSRTRTLFTIHNLAYQGYFSPALLGKFDISVEAFRFGMESGSAANMLKAGLMFSTALSTVSRKYAEEIQTPQYGNGLDGLLRARRGDLLGLLNGVDYGEWNPETDRFLPAHFSINDLSGKRTCKQALLERYQLPIDLDKPVVAIVSRMTVQKGIDLTADAMGRILDTGAYFVLLGSGDAQYEGLFQRVRDVYPTQVGVYFGFSNELSHLVEAGADMFLMPSSYEPCGLNQMYSLKYGTVPIVRGVGGLDDTITNFDRLTKEGNGFKFYEYASDRLVEKYYEALFNYYDAPTWLRIQRNGMRADHSWERAAHDYLDAYQRVVAAG